MMRAIAAALALTALASLAGCRDIAHFSSAGDRYEGPVVKGDFVRSGVADDVTVCMTIDTDHLQDTPGRISSSDGRFKSEPLRPIPQLWHDPLSTLSFGQGRDKNLLYVASAASDAGRDDVMVVVSLMTGGGIEVRLLRGAPPVTSDAGAISGSTSSNLFAVFALDRKEGPCSY